MGMLSYIRARYWEPVEIDRNRQAGTVWLEYPWPRRLARLLGKGIGRTKWLWVAFAVALAGALGKAAGDKLVSDLSEPSIEDRPLHQQEPNQAPHGK